VEQSFKSDLISFDDDLAKCLTNEHRLLLVKQMSKGRHEKKQKRRQQDQPTKPTVGLGQNAVAGARGRICLRKMTPPSQANYVDPFAKIATKSKPGPPMEKINAAKCEDPRAKLNGATKGKQAQPGNQRIFIYRLDYGRLEQPQDLQPGNS
jgi:hypothetical protein